MPRRSLAAIAATVLLTFGLARAARPADDTAAADAVLKAKGLTRSGSAYILPGEADVQKKLNEARTAYRAMRAGQDRRALIDYQAREGKQLFRELTAQRMAVNQQLAQPLPPAQHNQLVAMANHLTDQLNLIIQQQKDDDRDTTLDAAIASRREAYIQGILDLRTLVDEVDAAYKALAEDPEVKKALEGLAGTGRAKFTLGPSRNYQNNVKTLVDAEKSVLTENVALRKEGGIFWLDVTFNGKVTRPMAFDTGASTVVLPAEYAAAIGLKPGPDAPTVKCQVADGSVVEAKGVTVPVMRVGQFTVKDVPAVVMPDSKKDVPPLLGQSFQRNFLFKFSPDSGKLSLTRVDSGEDAAKTPAAKTKAKTSTKARGRR